MNIAVPPAPPPPDITPPSVDYTQLALVVCVALLLALSAYRTFSAKQGNGRHSISDQQADLILFGLIALGVVALLWKAFDKGLVNAGLDVAAFLLILQSIINAIKDRWMQRTVGRMGDQLAAAAPTDPPSPPPADASEAAQQTADAAQDEADRIERTQ